MPPPQRVALSYIVAVIAVVLSLALKFVLTPLGEDHPFVLLPAAVIIAAWYGGRAPGIVAAVLSAIGADLLFLAPTGFGATPADVLGLAGLLVEAVLIVEITVRLGEAQQRTRAEAAAADTARRELSLALRVRDELLAFWTERLHGPLAHLVLGLRTARLAVEHDDKPQALRALDGLVEEIQEVQRTAERWVDHGRIRAS
jgi:K+-sensing histidine kinase KdpD